MNKKILYFDMDNVLVDFQSGIAQLTQENLKEYDGRLDEVPGIFGLMKPLEGALDAFETLSKFYDSYILSTGPWKNSSAWSDKNEWVRKYLGQSAHKRLILSHHKNLNMGDYLIDDRTVNGAAQLNANRLRDVMASYKPSQPDLYGYASGRDGFKDTSMKFTAETIAKYFFSDDGYGKNIARQFSELVRGHLYRNRAKK